MKATWASLLAKSSAGAAVIAAAELGVASALGIIDWDAGFASHDDIGRRTVMWVTFIFATAVLGGVAMARHGVRSIRNAIANRRTLAAMTRTERLGAMRAARARALDAARGTAAILVRIGSALAAGLGALVAYALIWIPTTTAAVPQDQIATVFLAAASGILLGLVLAAGALYAAPVAVGAAATAGWVWAFALASIWLGWSAPGQPSEVPPPRLGVLDAPHLIGAGEWWLGPNLMIAIAALLGVAIAATARWVGSRRLAVALCGLAGPSLVATAYLVAGRGDNPDLTSGYIASLVAASVGLLATTATAVVHRDPAVRALPAGAQPSALTSSLVAAAALPAGPAPATRAARLAIEAPGTAGPTRVTLDAAYAATQPERGDAPLFEVKQLDAPAPVAAATAKPSKTKPSKPAKASKTSKALQPVIAQQAHAAKVNRRVQAERRGKSDRDVTTKPDLTAATAQSEKERGRSRRQSRQARREREHVDWVQNLVNTPNDPALNVRPRP